MIAFLWLIGRRRVVGAARQAIDRGAGEIDAQSTASARELPEKARAIARELAEKILGRKLAA